MIDQRKIEEIANIAWPSLELLIYDGWEFKQKAVELSFARGNAKEIAEELGIRPELLYRSLA